ncbi:MAG: hypothetical protein ACE5NG_02090 [bacterium]
MSPTKEKMISIIKTLSDDKNEKELIEEFLTKMMLEKSKEQFMKGQYIPHETVKKELLNGFG